MTRELLILTIDVPGIGAPKRGDVPGIGAPKRGDVLVMRPCGFPWGRMEHLAFGFLIVAMDLTDEQAEALLEEAPGIMPDGLDAIFRTSFVAYWETFSPVEMAVIAAADWLVVNLPPLTIRSR